MMHERLFKLEREAEKRVGDARDREIDFGGPGSARRASEAMNAPMLEVAKIRKMRQRFGDLQMEIDHHNELLQDADQDDRLAPEVKHHQVRQAETKLAGLTADFKALEAEAEQRFFPEAERSGEPRIYYRDGVTVPAPPPRRDQDAAPTDRGLPAIPRMKPTPPEAEKQPPVPRMRPEPPDAPRARGAETPGNIDKGRGDTLDKLRRSGEPEAEDAADVLEGMWQSGAEALERAADGLGEMWESGKAKAGEIAGETGERISEGWDAAGELAEEVGDWIAADEEPPARPPFKRRPPKPPRADSDEWTADFPRPRPRPDLGSGIPFPRAKPLPTPDLDVPFHMSSPVEGIPRLRYDDPARYRGDPEFGARAGLANPESF